MINVNHELYQEDLKQAASFIPKLDGNISVLVTGASGLIGSFLIDTFIYYNRNNINKIHIWGMSRNISRLKNRFHYISKSDHLKLVEQDISLPINFSVKFNYIIHAASNSDPSNFAKYPVETITANVNGIQNLLNYAKQNNEVRILYTSTREVYGNVNKLNSYKENDFGLIDFNNLRACYPESKRVSELLCNAYVTEYGLDCNVARLGYIYGPSMMEDDSKVIAQFIRKSLRAEDIILKSEGLQRRSYTYISDAVAGLLCILFNGNAGEAYNVANSNSIISIKEMAEYIAKESNLSVLYELPNSHELLGYSAPQDVIIDESKLITLGWNSKYTIYDGLHRTIKILKDDL